MDDALWSTWVAVAVPLLGGLLPAVARDWRWLVLGLLVAEGGTGWLLTRVWPVSMALALWMAGWLATAILGAGQGYVWQRGGAMPQAWAGRLFRFTIVGFALVLLVYQLPQALPWLPRGLTPEEAWAFLGLMVAGVLHLAMTQHPFRVTVSLLVLLAGFVGLYARLEQSLLLTVLLITLKLFLGAMGSYLLMVPPLEESP